MSGILKSIGKVFKKVLPIVKKVLPIALAVGAIVLTGGAAIGALPAVGTVLGGLGLSAGVTTALTSAVTMAGWGGLAGLVTGGTKGMVKGALIGGLLGGAGAALGVGGAAAGGVNMGSLGQTIAANGEALGVSMPGAATFSGLLGNGGLGSVLTGLGGGLTNAGEAKAAQEAYREKQKQLAKNYDISGSFLTQSLLSPYAQPGYMESPELDPFAGVTQWQYDPVQGKMTRKYQTAEGG